MGLDTTVYIIKFILHTSFERTGILTVVRMFGRETDGASVVGSPSELPN